MRWVFPLVLLAGCGAPTEATVRVDAAARVEEVFTIPPLPDEADAGAADVAMSTADVGGDVGSDVGGDVVNQDVAPQADGPLPVVLVHGFAGFRDIGPVGYFFNVARALRGDRRTVYEAVLPPFGSTPQRVPALREMVDRALRETGARRVVMIAHSQGGLDGRYLISSLGYGDRIAALVTVSTPHRGTPVADLFDSAIPGVADGVINAFATLLGVAYNEARSNADLRASLVAMRTSELARFNAANPDDPRVRYLSWAGRSNRRDGRSACADGEVPDDPSRVDNTTIFLAAFALIIEAGRPAENVNDGMIPVRSARWGRFMGCVPADHFDEVGQVAHTGPVPESGFDHIRFYRGVVARLAADGL